MTCPGGCRSAVEDEKSSFAEADILTANLLMERGGAEGTCWAEKVEGKKLYM